ncbi:hypothetical protein SAMN07250955_11632 [Arboricoccus pini]|uniref:DUF3467 domain-containing protein n=1 Tax=Arboricoccus pini TaxID=1963835 RepID=A0A212RWQ2_9PROT|nr:hypothetical protein [Arboricoccus pini]SNB77151.1 hypothetical protein SAMN07250955_11632 [Arboricoccus pini]
MTKPPAVPLVDNPNAPELFAADAVGFFAHEGVVYITFAAPKVNHSTSPSSLNRVVVGRLAMPVKGARQLAEGLFDFIKTQEDNMRLAASNAGRTQPTAVRSGRDKPN